MDINMEIDKGFEADSTVLHRPHKQGKGVYWQKRARTPLKRSIGEQATYLLRSNSVTLRDRELLRGLYHLKLLSKHQLARLFWREDILESTIDARIRKLYDRHLITRTINMMDTLVGDELQPCYVYMLDGVGEEILAREQGIERHQLGYKRRLIGDRLPHYLIHDLAIAECFVQLTLSARDINGLSARWLNEREASVRNGEGKEVVRPDGIIRLVEGERRIDLFLEMDRGATPWREKLEKYAAALDTVWGEGAYLNLLCVMPAKERVHIIDAVRKVNHPRISCYLKTWQTLLKGDFFAGWVQANNGEEKQLYPFSGG